MDIDKHTYVYKCTKFEAEVIYISQTLYIPSLAQKNGRKNWTEGRTETQRASMT